MKKRKPQILKDVHFAEIDEQLMRIFYEIIFRPLSQIIRQYTAQPVDAKKTLLNASDDALREAMTRGRIQYADGVFSGEFSAAIGRDLRTLGAEFDKRSKVYRLAAGRVPAWVKGIATSYNSKAREAHDLIRSKLDDIQRDLSTSVNVHTIDPTDTTDSIEKDFNHIAAQDLVVDPRLSVEGKLRLEREYTDNMKLWIDKFSRKTITDLRVIVEKNATQGYRFDKLIDGIKTRYGVTTSKAKFLARQETSMYMAKYRKERFGEAGVTRYEWSTSHDARVRPETDLTPRERLHAGNHRALDGNIFTYEKKAPAKYMSSGEPCNPGEDFNCRCIDRPILDPVEVAA